MELVDAPDSKSGSERSVGSIPTARTTSQRTERMFDVRTRIASLLIFAFSAVLAIGPSAQAGPSLVVELESGKIIAEDRAGQAWYPASLTKLMTAYLTFEAIRAGELKLDQEITVSKRANSMPASKIGFPTGSNVSVDLVLQSLLVYSANDMAIVLAEAVAGDVEHFVARMNARARQFGMNGTKFQNPNGLFAEDQVSTARDIAILARKLYRDFPEARHYYRQPEVVIGKAHLRNRNMLLRQMPNAEGMKTGYVCKAGFNLVAIAHDGKGRRLMAIVLGADGAQVRANWAQRLLEENFAAPAGPEKISDLRNSSAAPVDMSQEACNGKAPATISARRLKGWGVNLGQFGSRTDALRQMNEIFAANSENPGQKGIVRLPGKQGYGLFMWNLTAEAAQMQCLNMKKRAKYCELQSPEDFAEIIARLAPAAKTK